jgi:two-component system, NtrC family, nitrogen regulation response regulator NtrX
MSKILIVDDQPFIRETLRDVMEMQNHQVDEASSGNEAVQMVAKNKYDAVLLDIKMANGDGMETLPRLLTMDPVLPIIMMSGHGTIEIAVESMRMGAFDYLEKPLDNNRILATLRNALDRKELTNIIATRPQATRPSRIQIIGESRPIKDLLELIDTRLAPYDPTVIILGENGSGKELIAKRIHEQSTRRNKKYLSVNCSALVDTLLETTLFGCKKGAHSTAFQDTPGLFEEANGGTLFLDEVGDMSMAAQTKILRAVEYGIVQRVGEAKDIKVDVRIISATNKNVEQMVKDGTFREDLWHRLSKIRLKNPTLSERQDDIPLLITYFNNKLADEVGLKTAKKFSDTAIRSMQAYRWPGNIRELANAVERLNILCGEEITESDVQRYVTKD